MNEPTSCTIGCYSVAMVNGVDQNQLEWGRFIMEESQGRNWGQTLKLPNLLSYIAQEPLPRVALPTIGWALPQQSLIKEISGRHARKLIWWGWFLTWGFLFPADSSLCQVDKLRNTAQFHSQLHEKAQWGWKLPGSFAWEVASTPSGWWPDILMWGMELHPKARPCILFNSVFRFLQSQG